MLDSVHIKGYPHVSTETPLGPLKQLNYVYGPNGSGKTTISKYLRDAAGSPAGGVSGFLEADGDEVRVYNRDFVADTLSASEQIPGVFLLVSESSETRKALEELDGDGTKKNPGSIKAAVKLLESDTGNLQNAKDAKTRARVALRDAAWKMRNDVPEQLAPMWDGYRGDKERMLAEVLTVRDSIADPAAELVDQAELLNQAEAVFAATAEAAIPLASVAVADLESLGNASLLATEIVGAGESPMAGLIAELDISDWVRRGVPHLERAGGVCPFCQEPPRESLASELAAYFDEKFEKQKGDLSTLCESYVEEAQRVRVVLASHANSPERFLDPARFKAARLALEAVLSKNVALLKGKLENPSSVVELADVGSEVTEVQVLVDSANERIGEHNQRVADRKSERPKLVRRCWVNFVLTTLDKQLSDYDKAIVGPTAAIDALGPQVATRQEELKELRGRRAELLKHARSSANAVERINRHLASLEFTNFTIEEAVGNDGYYNLVRHDGTPALDTLSEGERTFITFLYYYFSLQGTEVADGTPRPTIAVIDDPISSLDSRIMWAVCQLIRNVSHWVVDPNHHVGQLIVLTHNAHFYNEVTYTRHRDKPLQDKRTFWTLEKKTAGPSVLKAHAKPPIRSTYQSLWEEVSICTREHHRVLPLSAGR